MPPSAAGWFTYDIITSNKLQRMDPTHTSKAATEAEVIPPWILFQRFSLVDG